MTKTLVGITGAAALLVLGSAQAQILRGGGEAGDYMRSHPDTSHGRDTDADRDQREYTRSMKQKDQDAADQARESENKGASAGASADLRARGRDLREGGGLDQPADMGRGKRPDARDSDR